MKRQPHRQKWSRLMALFLSGTLLQFLPAAYMSQRSFAQPAPATANQCATIVAPLTPEEEAHARTAWQYFVNNYQPSTGFVNSTGGYPSGTTWDMANYLMALNAVRWLNIIDQGDFDARLNRFLTSLSQIPLFEDSLPNKVYNAATGEMTDYANNPQPRGIGWSALDIGRMLAAFHILRTCHPQYADWLQSIVNRWDLARIVKDDGYMYGATVLPDGRTLEVQEGRLGYEEYAARGFELWGFKPFEAIRVEPFIMPRIQNLNIPADARDYQQTNANNYVVSESYILDGIEFGLQGYMEDYAASVFEAQRRRFEETGILTAVSEDNIDQPPYFLYNTVYSNGVPWAVITEANEQYQQFRTLSVKTAFGWRYFYPNDPYAQRIFDAVKDLRDPDNGGFYAGRYEQTNEINRALTGNTNGLILEILFYKARGNRPLVDSNLVTFAEAPPTGNNLIAQNPNLAAPRPVGGAQAATPPRPAPTPQPTTPVAPSPTPAPTPSAIAPSPPPATTPSAIAVQPIAPVGRPQANTLPQLARPLRPQERRYAEAAWNYFRQNYEQRTGLVSDRNDFRAVTLWGIGDYLAALNAARVLEIVSADEFDQRTRLTLGAIQQLPLFAGEVPTRSYDIQTLRPVDYGGNPTTQGTGWSALDIGRLMSALHTLKTNHPQYTDAVDRILLNWSYLRVIRDQRVLSATAEGSQNLNIVPENRLGYEEYAARAFQLWGFEADRSAVGGQYQTATVEGQNVPTRRLRPDVDPEANRLTVSNPFFLYGLEFGFDPQIRQLVEPIRRAQAERYRRTGTLTAGGTTILDRAPYVVNSTVIAGNQPWATLGDDGRPAPDARMVSTATAFSYYALYPGDTYSTDLFRSVTDLYDNTQGYYEGFFEQNAQPVRVYSSSTNSRVLQSLLYLATNGQPIVRENRNLNSPWWQAVAQGGAARGLPIEPRPTIQAIADSAGGYWLSRGEVAARTPSQSTQPTQPTQPAATVTPPQPRPAQEFVAPPVSPSPAPIAPPVAVSPPAQTVAAALPPQLRRDADRVAAQIAWQYFERNWNSNTGLVSSSDNTDAALLWDQGNALLGLHSGRQLGFVGQERFNTRLDQLLRTLENIPVTELSNPALSSQTGRLIRQAFPGNTLVVDRGRFLLAMHVLRTNYPEYSQRITSLIGRWNLPQQVQQDLLSSSSSVQQGYVPYLASILRLWNTDVSQLNTRLLQASSSGTGGASDRAIDPYTLWGMEIGWPEAMRSQILNLVKAQAQQSYMKNYTVSTNAPPWLASSDRGQPNTTSRFVSTKAAFAWESVLQDDPYAQSLRQYVQNLAEQNRGYLSGRYETPRSDMQPLIDVNTNAMILQSLLYQARDGRPLAS